MLLAGGGAFDFIFHTPNLGLVAWADAPSVATTKAVAAPSAIRDICRVIRGLLTSLLP